MLTMHSSTSKENWLSSYRRIGGIVDNNFFSLEIVCLFLLWSESNHGSLPGMELKKTWCVLVL